MKKIIVSNHFLKLKKHSSKKLQLEIDIQVKSIVKIPSIGDLKKGDLKGVRVLKFKFNNQAYLLSYMVKNKNLYLYTIGSHENYYKKLKRFLD